MPNFNALVSSHFENDDKTISATTLRLMLNTAIEMIVDGPGNTTGDDSISHSERDTRNWQPPAERKQGKGKGSRTPTNKPTSSCHESPNTRLNRRLDKWADGSPVTSTGVGIKQETG